MIGWIVGGFFLLVLEASLRLFSIEISVLLAMIASVMLTGAFHEDGFADVCDGFGGGWTKERILSIMKDSRVGAYGVIGLILLFLLKYNLLILITPSSSLWVLVATILSAQSLSRLTAVSIVFTDLYVRDTDESKARPVAQAYGWKEITGAFVFGLIPLVGVPLEAAAMMIVGCLITRICMSVYFRKWIGGYTGDCLGGTQQTAEVVIYLMYIAAWKFF